MSFFEQLSRDFQNYFSLEQDQMKKTRIFYVSPFVKSISTIILLIYFNYIIQFFVSEGNKILISLIMSSIISLLALVLKIQIKTYFKFLVILGFIFPLIVTSINLIIIKDGITIFELDLLGFNLSITEGALYSSIKFMTTMLLNISLIAFFILSTPFIHIIHSLNHIGLPNIVITTLALTYRYFYLFFENLLQIFRADSCRRFGKYPFKKRFNHIGLIFGILLLRSIKKGENIHYSMQTRGFNGSFPIVDFSTNINKSIIYSIFAIIIPIVITLIFM